MSVTIKNIFAYIQGNYRYKLFYSPRFKFLMRLHIFEQIAIRIMSMDKKCYKDGQCRMCGCSTTALQMANKACDKPCYPPMMNKKNWLSMKSGETLDFNGVKWKTNGLIFERV